MKARDFADLWLPNKKSNKSKADIPPGCSKSRGSAAWVSRRTSRAALSLPSISTPRDRMQERPSPISSRDVPSGAFAAGRLSGSSPRPVPTGWVAARFSDNRAGYVPVCVAQWSVSRVEYVLGRLKSGTRNSEGTFAGEKRATDASGKGFGRLDFGTDAIGGRFHTGKSRFASMTGVFGQPKETPTP